LPTAIKSEWVKSKKVVSIPSEIELNLEGSLLNVRGNRGENQKLMTSPLVRIKKEDTMLNFYARGKEGKITKKEKRVIGTFAAHISNLIIGITEGFEYKLKICSGHFPMTVKVESEEVVIKNFLGEKVPRKARISSGVSVDIKGDIISVKGIDIGAVSQTAARIEQSTRITNRDRRVFQDGCYITEKAGIAV